VNALRAADNRYYSNAYGRFMTPDRYRKSANPNAPQSWNRYAYVVGDPTNNNDPTGLCVIDGVEYPDGGDECPNGTGVTVTGSGDPPPPTPDPDPSDPEPSSTNSTPGDPAGQPNYPSVWTPNCGWIEVTATFNMNNMLSCWISTQQQWQNCYNAVQQQQDAAAISWLEFIDNNYLFFEGIGFTIGAGVGFGLGAGPVGALLGSHIGMLSVDQFHTLIAIALNYYANLSPSPAAVAATCGPKPGN